MKLFHNIIYILIFFLITNFSNAQENIISGATGVAKNTAGYNKWMMFKKSICIISYYRDGSELNGGVVGSRSHASL